ncbi:hypothetical protein [Edaphobacter modestus]|uniref:Uncharacterized protein n=1 Tax=Edaphobacter modestus TaxID=388466 RepID=A0A4Q7YWP1_9BACT|nr:hypothetical protein [Edaphobacter modestus]RZU41479.1 hypothetical protein BDD14_3002 [Edaphobacter modestus]
MSTPPPGKYQLRSLHEEIGLFDRKLAHVSKYESFPTEADREVAVSKLNSKRKLLVRNALQMAKDGVEFDPSELPASLRAEETPNEPLPVPSVEIDAQPETDSVAKAKPDSSYPSPYAGTALDCRQEVQAYKQSKARKQA